MPLSFPSLAHLPQPAPLYELRDELVELRRAQYAYRDRARQHGPLMRVPPYSPR
jgi:hypothetical protein